MKEEIIRIENVCKTYSGSDKPALWDINLNVNHGERVGLIGSNGSGKTTLLRLLMNFIIPDEGEISIRGQRDLEKAHQFLGFVAESQEGLENFTPRELFSSVARMYGMNYSQAKKRADELLIFSGLSSVADDLMEGFSKGMAQRAFISLALMHDPDILLLDEPMSGLDPKGQNEVRNLLRKLMHKTIIYASHNLEEIEEFTSSVIFLHEGKILHRLKLNEIKQEIYLIDVDFDISPLLNRFRDLSPKVVGKNLGRVELKLTATTKEFQDFLQYCKNGGIDIYRIRSRSVLEDAYNKYIRTS